MRIISEDCCLFRAATWLLVSVVCVFGCSSTTAVGSFDPAKQGGTQSICHGHNARCRESCSAAGVRKSVCTVHPDGTLQQICECRDGPATPIEPESTTGGVGGDVVDQQLPNEASCPEDVDSLEQPEGDMQI